jgi:AraC-like DNA-binding protein
MAKIVANLNNELSCFNSLPKLRNHGVMNFDPVWAITDHYSSGSELLYILSGCETLHVGDDLYEAQSGDVVILPPNVLHRDEFDLDKCFSVFMLSYDWAPSAISLFYQRVTNSALLALSDSDKARIIECLECFRDDVEDPSEAEMVVLNARLLELLMTIYDLTCENCGKDDDRDSKGKRTKLLMKRAKAYCEEHLSEPLSLDIIADELEVSSFYLSRAFSAESNFSLFAYLTHLRMEKAKQLLLPGNMIVADVAYAVGYSDSNYFSKAFRNHVGAPPSHFMGRNL